ncbi:MAG: TetR/AcrR family transcriptional regulator C-terminal domain-containing protein [Anaerovoracaceae bacterium]
MANLTKKAIAASVTRLLEKKPIDKITIREITDDCGMTRNTFYYHFQDIYDLCSWIFAAQAEELIGRYKKDDSGLGEMFVEGLEYLYGNKRMIRHVYDSISRGDLSLYLVQVISKYAMEIIELYAEDMPVSEEAVKLTAEFYQHAFVARVLQWISDDMDLAPDKLAMVCECMFRGP